MPWILRKTLLALSFLSFSWVVFQFPASAENPDFWDQNPNHQTSVSMKAVRESATSHDGLELALKHFPRPGAQPVLLIHGLAQNDRCWDELFPRYSFARFLHAQGFDVWVGNLRGVGTEGFRSEAPYGPKHWTVDDYAALDIPALIDEVVKKTGTPPFVVGHSLAAWALEGYLAGVHFKRDGRLQSNPALGKARQTKLKGVITIAGIYNIYWEHALADAWTHPIRNEVDYYHSSYEMEFLAGIKPLTFFSPYFPTIPASWIGSALHLSFQDIPLVGWQLQALYQGIQLAVISSPILNLFYYPENVSPQLVRTHVRDGLEDLGPYLLEQIANAHNDQRTSSYYHLDRPENAYNYASGRSQVDLPLLFIGGGRDRLASALQIYQDGYEMTQAKDKQYLQVEKFGHLDILSGTHAPSEVMTPVTKWMRERM